MRNNFLPHLALALTLVSVQTLMAAKVKVMVEAPAAAAVEALQTRSIQSPATVQVQPPGAVPVGFGRIVPKTTAAGSSVYLTPVAINRGVGAMTPRNFSITQVVPQIANNALSLAPTGIVKPSAATLNGAQAPTVPDPAGLNAAGVPYPNPLYDVFINHFAVMGDHLVAVPDLPAPGMPDGRSNVFVLAGGSPDALVSTADTAAHPAAGPAAAVALTPLLDGNGEPVDHAIAGLATSSSTIYAAVPQRGQDFAGDSQFDRGVARLTLQGNTLVQQSVGAFGASDELTLSGFNVIGRGVGGIVPNDVLTRLANFAVVQDILNARPAAPNQANYLAMRLVLLLAYLTDDAAGITAAIARDVPAAARLVAVATINAIAGIAIGGLNPGAVAQAVGAALQNVASGPIAGGTVINAVTNGQVEARVKINRIIEDVGAAGPRIQNLLEEIVFTAIRQGVDAQSLYANAAAYADAQAMFYDRAINGGRQTTNATLNRQADQSGVVMHYDSVLDRLFVGYKNLRKSGAARQGGLVGIVVNEPDANVPGALNFRSILYQPSKALFQDDSVAATPAEANTQNLGDKIFALYNGALMGNGAGALAAHAVSPLVGYQLPANAADTAVSVHQLKTMHTSTGRHYLIVASSITTPGGGPAIVPPGAPGLLGMLPGGGGVVPPAAVEVSGLYFIPIMGTKNSIGQQALPHMIGKVTDSASSLLLSGAAVPVGGVGVNPPTLDANASRVDLPTHAKNAIAVGTVFGVTEPVVAAPALGFRASEVQDLQVVGDSVIVSFAKSDNPGNNELFGVYQTTAIFNNAGDIVRWTPLQRTSGAVEKVQSAVMDTASGNLMYLGNNGEAFNLTDWGVNRAATRELKALIATTFPADRGGVRGIYTFDDATSSFDQRRVGGVVNKTALTVVIGYDTVMVAQTMKFNNPAKHFYDASALAAARVAGAHGPFGLVPEQNVFVFNNNALKSIAPLTCAEVLRINVPAAANAVNGYLYVGGYKGVCRLQDARGNGWSTGSTLPLPGGAITGLAHFANDTAGFNFEKLNNPVLKDVVKIISAPATGGGVKANLALVMNGSVALVNASLLTQVASLRLDAAQVNVLDLSANAPVFDAQLFANFDVTGAALSDDAYLILATASGLVVVDKDIVAAPANRAVVPLNGTDIPLQIAYVPLARGGRVAGDARINGGGGMFYVLAGDQATGAISMYRYEARFDALAANVLTPVAGGPKPISLNTFRRYFATDGLKFFTGHDAALDTSDMLNMLTMANATAAPLSLTSVLGGSGLGDFLTSPVRDAVTGAWMVTGSFGLTAND